MTGKDPAQGSGAPVLPIRGEGLVVERGGARLIDGIDIKIGLAHGVSVILGPNGAGKSLLLRLLANLVQPDRGRVTWAGVAADRARATRVGFVLQRPAMLRRSVLANIAFALAAGGIRGAEQQRLARKAIETANLGHLAERAACALSGGEQQRVALARALAPSPEVLLLDEPSANLDPASVAALEAMILRAAGTTPVVLVTHDLAQARRVANRVLFMHKGRILERTGRELFFDKPQTPEAEAFLRGEIVL